MIGREGGRINHCSNSFNGCVFISVFAIEHYSSGTSVHILDQFTRYVKIRGKMSLLLFLE